jgi:hypothetical protein
MLSDAAFGNLPAKFLRTFNPSTVQVGDILHYNNHFIVVLERASNGFIVAEGNVNQQVMWGRLITDAEIRANFEHHITRYPEVILGDVNLDGVASLLDVVYLNKALAGSVTLNEKAALNAAYFHASAYNQ